MSIVTSRKAVKQKKTVKQKTTGAKKAEASAAEQPGASTWGHALAAHVIAELDRVQALLRVGMTELEMKTALGASFEGTPGSTLLCTLGPLPKPPTSGEPGDRWLQPTLGLTRVKKKAGLTWSGGLYLEWNSGGQAVSAADCRDFIVAARTLLEPRCGRATTSKGAMVEVSFPETTSLKAKVRCGITWDTPQLMISFEPA